MRVPKLWLACGLAAGGLVLWLSVPADRLESNSRELDDDCATLTRVREAKDVLLADLRAGRTTLAAAADTYYALVVVCQRLLDGLRFTEPQAESDLERAAIRLSDHALDDVPPADRPALAARLDAEFRDRFPTASPTPVAAAGGQ